MSIEPSPESNFSLTDTLPTGAPAVTRIVDRLATRMTEREIAVALDLGHVAAFGVSPSRERLSVAWAMVCHETGRGQVGLYCFNIANVDATEDWTGDIFSLTANEGSGATTHAMTKWLRAYPDAYSGAVGWWQFMAREYAAALTVFDTGDGERSAESLRRYFTGDMAALKRELRLLSSEFLKRRKDGGL